MRKKSSEVLRFFSIRVRTYARAAGVDLLDVRCPGPDRLVLERRRAFGNGGVAFAYLRFDALFLGPFGRSGLVVIAFACRGDGAGNDVHSVVVRDFITGDGERLLKHQAVLVVGVAVASKAEVPQTVDNVAPLVFLIALDDVGMRAYHKMRAGIDGAVRKLDLNIVWHVFPFDPPSVHIRL